MKTSVLLLFCTAVFSSCQDFVVEQRIIENYYLTASDELDGTALSYHEPIDGSNYGTIIDATVFAAGVDNRYMIVKQHPRNFPNPSDKSITNYYILPLKARMDWRTKNGLIGPLTLEQFNAKRKQLDISGIKFTTVLKELE